MIASSALLPRPAWRSRTTARFFADGVIAADALGRHQRSLVARDGDQGNVDLQDGVSVRRAMTYTYQLFPATGAIKPLPARRW